MAYSIGEVLAISEEFPEQILQGALVLVKDELPGPDRWLCEIFVIPTELEGRIPEAAIGKTVKGPTSHFVRVKE
jgi:hypothetical protein